MGTGVGALAAALFIAGLSSTAMAASASSASGTIAVQATVVSTCSVANSDIPFGSVTPATGVAVPTPVAVAVTCSLSTPFSVGLSDGLYGYSGARRMKRSGSSDYLTYSLYKDASTASRFGDTGATDRASGVGQGVSATPIAVYSNVPTNQSAPSGVYSDTVQISIYY